jgi:eukaryotic-like serine/threonine-protein kinase
MSEDPLVGQVVGTKYRVTRKLGEGGMSIVYEARHVKLNRAFAIKRLLPSLVDHAEARARFEREAELLGSLRHPNVVEVTDWEVLPDGTPCMVLEFLHGNDLSVRLARGSMPWDAIARIGDQMMSALGLAHRTGITHRDLKPENLFISIDDAGDERVKLLDFGISKLRGVGNLTGYNAMLGTPSYMSPEQATGNSAAIGPSTDVWAMGALLYEMATGVVAFRGDSLAAILMLILEGRPDPITMYRPDASAGFVELIDRALSRDPARRIQTIEDLRSGLRTALEPRNVYRLNTPIAGIPVVRPPPRPPEPGPARAPRRGLWIGGTVAIAFALGVLANILWT